MNRVPLKEELSSAFGEYGLNICQSGFSLSICGTIKQSQENDLLNKIEQSWQLSPGGIGNSSQIHVQKQGIDEFLSENSEFKTVSNFRYLLTVDGIAVDQFNTNFNYESIKKYFFENSLKDFRECPADYPLSDAFRIITPNRLCDANTKRIEEIVANWFKLETMQSNEKIEVKILQNAIEEQLDDLS